MSITNGVHADLIFVAARTDASVKGTLGISIFAVERGTPGLTVGRAFKKQGWLSSDTAELVFADGRIPAVNRLVDQNVGLLAIIRNVPQKRLVPAALVIDAAQDAHKP